VRIRTNTRTLRTNRMSMTTVPLRRMTTRTALPKDTLTRAVTIMLTGYRPKASIFEWASP
jgi:hypothetical protein